MAIQKPFPGVEFDDDQLDCADALQQQVDNTYYQPVLNTEAINKLLKHFCLKDTLQNRWCIAMIERREGNVEAVYIVVEDLISLNILEEQQSKDKAFYSMPTIMRARQLAEELEYENKNKKETAKAQ